MNEPDTTIERDDFEARVEQFAEEAKEDHATAYGMGFSLVRENGEAFARIMAKILGAPDWQLVRQEIEVERAEKEKEIARRKEALARRSWASRARLVAVLLGAVTVSIASNYAIKRAELFDVDIDGIEHIDDEYTVIRSPYLLKNTDDIRQTWLGEISREKEVVTVQTEVGPRQVVVQYIGTYESEYSYNRFRMEGKNQHARFIVEYPHSDDDFNTERSITEFLRKRLNIERFAVSFDHYDVKDGIKTTQIDLLLKESF